MPLDPPSWTLNEDRFLKSFTSRTKAVVLNRWLIPTGACWIEWMLDRRRYLHIKLFAQDMPTDPTSIILPLQPTQSNREGLQQRGVAYYRQSLSEDGLLCNNWWGRSATSSKGCSFLSFIARILNIRELCKHISETKCHQHVALIYLNISRFMSILLTMRTSISHWLLFQGCKRGPSSHPRCLKLTV